MHQCLCCHGLMPPFQGAADRLVADRLDQTERNDLVRQQLHRPFPPAIGRCAAREGDDMRFLLTAQYARPADPGRLIERPVQAILDKAAAHALDGTLPGVQRGGDLFILLPFVGVQQDLCPIDASRPLTTATDQRPQLLPLRIDQVHQIDFLHHRLLRWYPHRKSAHLSKILWPRTSHIGAVDIGTLRRRNSLLAE
jgi:hypothetical protein